MNSRDKRPDQQADSAGESAGSQPEASTDADQGRAGAALIGVGACFWLTAGAFPCRVSLLVRPLVATVHGVRPERLRGHARPAPLPSRIGIRQARITARS